MSRTHWVTAAVLCLLVGCSGKDAEIGTGQGPAAANSEPAARPALSALQMADPAAAPQLLSGFHDVEQSAWRWTERKFSVDLQAPAGSKTARLNFRFAISPVVIERLKTITLTAATGGVVIGTESYESAGEYTFSKPLPPAAAGGQPLRIDFELDRAIPAGELETRELGVIAISVGLE